MKLYIMRHSIAEEATPHKKDNDRKLTKKGKKKALKMIKKLKKADEIPEFVLSSPLKRAVQTAELFTQSFSDAITFKTVDSLKPAAQYKDLINDINRHAASSCIIIGHDPMLSSFISYLLTGEKEMKITLKKAGICCVSFADKAGKGSGNLEWLINREDF